ncbi:MAG: 1-phosphofructokinase family hexose kinase [Aggregatilineales bacterium]
MILSITANTGIDRTIFIPELLRGHTIRANRTVYSMAGKPCNASTVLAELGVPVTALGFAAGAIGQQMQTMLHKRGIQTDFTEVDGESRMNLVIIDESDSSNTTITPDTLQVTPEHVANLKARLAEKLRGAACVIMGGSLPNSLSPEFYVDLLKQIKAADVPVIFDATGNNLKAGLQVSPDFIKPNEYELASLIGEPVTSLEMAYEAGKNVLDTYGTIPIITLGKMDALAVLPHATYRIPALDVPVVSAAGAGDSVVAGMATAIHRGQSLEDGLKLGIAAAAATIMQAGTAESDKADIERLQKQVELVPYP